MKQLFYLILCSCFLSNMVHGQTTLVSTPKTLSASKSAQLDAQFGANRYQAYTLDATALINQARNGASTLQFTLSLGQVSFPVTAHANEYVLSDDFSVISYEHGQAQDLTASTLLTHYQGTLDNDPSVSVSVSVTNLGIHMTLSLPGGDMTFTPTFIPLLGEYEADEYVFHEAPVGPGDGGCEQDNLFPMNNCTPPAGCRSRTGAGHRLQPQQREFQPALQPARRGPTAHCHSQYTRPTGV